VGPEGRGMRCGRYRCVVAAAVTPRARPLPVVQFTRNALAFPRRALEATK
jgi:hypothetical protein